MKRLTGLILAGWFLCLGTGLASYLHELQHDAEDRREDSALIAAGQPVPDHHHDDDDCPVHAQLHMPLIAVAWSLWVLGEGKLVDTLSLPPMRVIACAPLVRVDCRGPPVTAVI